MNTVWAMIGAALTALFPVVAFAGLEICNETGEAHLVALGYKGDTDWSSEGWWRIKAGSCTTVVKGDLTRRYYYFHAASRSGVFKGEDYVFCTTASAFTIIGDTGCETRGYQKSDFREIDTGKTAKSFTLTLTPDVFRTPSTYSAEAEGGSTVSTKFESGDVLKNNIPAGTHGKPVTLNALFQGCELLNGEAYCSFHSNGHKFKADYDGDTPLDILYALEAMPILAAVQIEADQVARKGREASIVLRKVTPRGQPNAFHDLHRAFQGDWVKVNDQATSISVRGSEIHVRHNTEYRVTHFMDFADECPGATATGPKLLQSTPSDKEPKCFLVTRADTELELLPVNDGPIIRYRRP